MHDQVSGSVRSHMPSATQTLPRASMVSMEPSGLFVPKRPRMENVSEYFSQPPARPQMPSFRPQIQGYRPQRPQLTHNSPMWAKKEKKAEKKAQRKQRKEVATQLAFQSAIEKARVHKEFPTTSQKLEANEGQASSEVHKEGSENDDEEAPDEEESEDGEAESQTPLSNADIYPYDYPHLVRVYQGAKLGQLNTSKEGDLAICGKCASLGHKGRGCPSGKPEGTHVPDKALKVLNNVVHRLKEVNDQVVQQRKKGTFDETKAEIKPKDAEDFIIAIKKLFTLTKIKPHSLKICPKCGEVGHSGWTCGGKNKLKSKMKAIKKSIAAKKFQK
uniref:CCHC-type domain-containing protein n=1 Tax=Acrobeloides nanus TaxID=290746 RepID=A0A914CK95_9BILA